MRGRVRVALGLGVGVCVVLLSWPATPRPTPMTDSPTPFHWDADALFVVLEARFQVARAASYDEAARRAVDVDLLARPLIERIADSADLPALELDSLSHLEFEYATLAAAHSELLGPARAFVDRIRREVTRAAVDWPADRATHEALYRVLFGGRVALEEAMVQAGPSSSAIVQIEAVPSATPSVDVQGVRVHSGDILLSRGGAPTSALIARGNDFANTFSHVALVHVDEAAGGATVIESLIEAGSELSAVADYLASKKHRILVLRMRPDHPALADDPMLPHRAATRMLERFRAEEVPYDFAMNWSDDGAMFCSEVVSGAYGPEGVDLWTIRSAMTAPGLIRWLAAIGVEEFTTLVPSDLEYDAQLRAVAEWRNVDALMDYRLDNAITDVLLEKADEGTDLGYAPAKLPLARLARMLSFVQSAVGARPLIPMGMSADAALRVSSLVSTVNPTVKADLVARELRFSEEHGYRAPYWTLVDLARESLEAVRDDLGPALD